MTILAWFNPARWLMLAALMAALTVSYLGWRGHQRSIGAATVRVVLDQERAAQVQAALTASEKRRNDEKALTIINQGVTHAYAKEKSRLVAAAATLAGRLRELQAVLDSAASADSAPLGGADDPRGRIAGECAAALGVLDGYAQEVAAKATALQDYASRVRVTP